MKRIVSLLIVAILLLGCAQANNQTLYVSEQKGLNLRSAADFSSDKLITLWCGEPVYVIGTEGDFTQIVTKYGEGYVYSTGLSSVRSKNTEMFLHMYVDLKTAGDKLNVRSVPYLPAEFANEPIDKLVNGTAVTAINQYGFFVEIIYTDKDGLKHSGYVSEDCLRLAMDKDVYEHETCHVCEKALDNQCRLITEADGTVYLVCHKCYNLGICKKCNQYVYLDQRYTYNGSNPLHVWCVEGDDFEVWQFGRPVITEE